MQFTLPLQAISVPQVLTPPLVPAPNSVGTQLAVVRPLWRSLALGLVGRHGAPGLGLLAAERRNGGAR